MKIVFCVCKWPVDIERWRHWISIVAAGYCASDAVAGADADVHVDACGQCYQILAAAPVCC